LIRGFRIVTEEAPYVFKPNERPTFPGSPANPAHPRGRQIAYLLIGALIGLTSGLGNALIQVNLNFIQGSLGLYSDEGAWLTAAYLMANVPANLVLVKYRQQFGLRSFVRISLIAYVTATLLHLFVDTFWTAILVRAVSGVAAAGLTSLSALYILQGVSAAQRLNGLAVSVGIGQLATPLARVMSPYLLVSDDWHMTYWFELGLALMMLAAVTWLSLPPSERSKAFERVDALVIALLAPGLWLLTAVLSEGRIYWWTDTPWLGWALAASVLLVAGGLMIEQMRENPLMNMRFLGSGQMARLILGAACARILISEQSFGSIGFLGVFGLINDQMVLLQAIVLMASIAGIVASVLTFDPANTIRSFMVSCVLIAIGAWMDMHATNLTRVENFYISQALIAFGALYFIGPIMMIGIARVLLVGPKYFISFIVLFGLSQNIGGLVGTSLLGTFQTLREKFHSNQLVESLVLTNPLVAARVSGNGNVLAGAIGDPVLRNAQGIAQFAAQVTGEANVLAYNDVFLLVFVLACACLLWAIQVRISMVRRGEQPPIIQLMNKLKAAAQQQTVKP
jgi:MFS family permease